MSDPAKYRSREEVQKVRQESDPIEQVKKRIVADGIATEDELKALDKEVKTIAASAAEFAQTDAEPDPSELYTDILR
jgi:pyruvate dehydrogenase E1 component alpha subunit